MKHTSSSPAAPIRKSRWESNPNRNSNPIPHPNRNPNPNPNSNPNRNSNSNPNRNPNPSPKASPAAKPSAQEPSPSHPAAATAAPPAPPPPPPYDFHNLERRTIMLVDGTARSYFALPPDYPVDAARRGFGQSLTFGRGGGPQHEYTVEGTSGPTSSTKRRLGERDELLPNPYPPQGAGPGREPGENSGRFGAVSTHRQEFNEDSRMSKQARLDGEGDRAGGKFLPSRDKGFRGMDVDPLALKWAFLKYYKVVTEAPIFQRKCLEDDGPLPCVVCRSYKSSQDFPNLYGLILHTYNCQDAEWHIDHLGLHKALCVLVGWDYLRAPLNSKTNMLLSAEKAQANRDDIIIWPPTVIMHNTFSGRTKDGRELALGNIEMDSALKELGFGVGKAKKVFGKDGHTGTTVVKFDGNQAGLKEAERLAEYFEKNNRGRNGWERAEASRCGGDDKNPALVTVDPKTGEKKRIFYGYLGTASDLDKLDLDMMKKVVFQSRKELDIDLFG